MTTRTEQLTKVGATITVESGYFDIDGAMVMPDLLRSLERTMERTGRLPVGEVEVERHHDRVYDRWTYTAVVKTRQSDQGEWPSVWAAVREDGWL